MRAIRFTFVDMTKSKVQILVLLLLAIVELWMMKMYSSPLNAVYYMYFGAIVTSVQPFLQEQTAEVGFINMLPGTKQNRVLGRYLFGLSLIIISMFISIVNLGIYYAFSHNYTNYVREGMLDSFSIALIFCSLQYILFYALGKMRSQQLAGLIMMIPAFLMFFGVNYVIEYMASNKIITTEWISQNRISISLGVFLFSVVIFIFGIYISTIIVKKKDYV